MIRWKSIKNTKNNLFISTSGQVFSMKSKRNLKNTITTGGYLSCFVNQGGVTKEHKLHREVALAFIPNPENKPQVNHKDGNKKNNNVENLEWVTSKENADHAKKNNLINPCRSEKHGRTKLKNKDVLDIVKKHSAGRNVGVIARSYGISKTSVYGIVNGKFWKEVTKL